MSAIQTLITEYPGDEAWTNFVQAVGAEDSNVASVLAALSVTDEWLTQCVPALENKTPNDVLELPNGLSAVRSTIMRFP